MWHDPQKNISKNELGYDASDDREEIELTSSELKEIMKSYILN